MVSNFRERILCHSSFLLTQAYQGAMPGNGGLSKSTCSCNKKLGFKYDARSLDTSVQATVSISNSLHGLQQCGSNIAVYNHISKWTFKSLPSGTKLEYWYKMGTVCFSTQMVDDCWTEKMDWSDPVLHCHQVRLGLFGSPSKFVKWRLKILFSFFPIQAIVGEEQTLFDMLANKAVQETCSKDLDIIACVFNHPKVQDQLVNNHSFR